MNDRADTQDLQAALRSTQDQHVYMQDVAKFLMTYFYAPTQQKNQIVGFQSLEKELFWLRRGPSSLFLRNMHCSTALPVTTFDSMAKQPGSHLFVVFNDPREEWIGMELRDSRRVAHVEPVGHAYGGQLLRVTFIPSSSKADSDYWQCPAGYVR